MKGFLVLIGMLGTLTSCVQAQTPAPLSALRAYYGITLCIDDSTYSFVRTDLPPWEFAGVVAHEAKHREQRTRFKNCQAFAKWHSTPKGMLESEAEAYMTGLCAEVALGADRATREQEFTERIERQLGGELNRLDIVQALHRWDCP